MWHLLHACNHGARMAQATWELACGSACPALEYVADRRGSPTPSWQRLQAQQGAPPGQVASRQQRGIQPDVGLPAGKLVQHAVGVDAHQLLNVLVACAAGLGAAACRGAQVLPPCKGQQAAGISGAGSPLLLT